MTDPNLIQLIIYSIGCSFALISVVAVCVCGCRKGVPKNELMGVVGMVKITNPDENVNHLPAVGNYTLQNTNEEHVIDTDDSSNSKRNAGNSNPHRSLPDIPIYTEGDIRVCDNGVSGDTSSELYATVDDKNLSAAYNKRHTLPNGVEPRPSLSHQSSISQSDSNYARLKENPYDKVKKSENPYANVKTNSKETEESSREVTPRSSWNNITRVESTEILAEPSTSSVLLERGRRPSVDGSTNDLNNSSPVSDIPAAPAVAGRVAASQDLPYMTPPITQPQHFSGDSQDSSRGYTSISVREPLANIISQTPAIRNRRNNLDPHYSTVSDDSDEMYAAIIEPSANIYNGSETYAQIQPVTVAEIHGHNDTEEMMDDEDDQYEPAPQPPSVDSLKHVAHVHSRQASSSSCTSSVANLGSPKPEKRQANSPLPPPPAVSPDLLHTNGDEKNSSSVVRNLEDMYAKVQKNKRKSDDTPQASSSSGEVANNIPISKCNKKRWSRDSFEDFKHLDACENDAHCYETLNKGDKKSKIKISSTPNNNSGPESLLSNDPGYEQLSPQNRAPSESDPNYEVLRPQRTNSMASDCMVGYSTIGNKKDKGVLTVPECSSNNKSILTEDGYSVVNKSNKKLQIVCSEPGYEEILNKIIDEPNYESMPSEDNYATINNNKSTDNESDPNYESVKYLDVHLSKGEPPYERLQDETHKNEESAVKSSDCSENSDNKSSKTVSDYERIKNSASSKDSDNNSEDISGYTPEYDRIKSSENSDSSRLSSTPEYERLKEGSSNNSEEQLDYKLHNGEVLVVEQASIILTVSPNDITEVKINIPPDTQKDTIDSEGDIFHV